MAARRAISSFDSAAGAGSTLGGGSDFSFFSFGVNSPPKRLSEPASFFAAFGFGAGLALGLGLQLCDLCLQLCVLCLQSCDLCLGVRVLCWGGAELSFKLLHFPHCLPCLYELLLQDVLLRL